MPRTVSYHRSPISDLDRQQRERLVWIESAKGPIIALASEYPDGHLVAEHRHNRSQLLHALSGVVLIKTSFGRWMVPPDHAMWLPAGIEHAVEMLGNVSMRSVYVEPDAVPELPDNLRVVAMGDLMRSLVVEAVELDTEAKLTTRETLLLTLLLHEIPRLPERPFGLPFPAEQRLAALCRSFVASPSPHATIDEWADIAGMSRRTFTRVFQRQTGLSFSTWRQQACLFAALPRLADGEPITRVALDLGYDSVPAFTTMFKRMLGTSPRGYMRAAGVSFVT